MYYLVSTILFQPFRFDHFVSTIVCYLVWCHERARCSFDSVAEAADNPQRQAVLDKVLVFRHPQNKAPQGLRCERRRSAMGKQNGEAFIGGEKNVP